MKTAAALAIEAPTAPAPPKIDPALLLRRGLPAALAEPLAELAEKIQFAPDLREGESVWFLTSNPKTAPADREEAIAAARELAEEAILEGARGALVLPEISNRGRWHAHGFLVGDLDAAIFAEAAWRGARPGDRANERAVKIDLLEVSDADAARTLVYTLKSMPSFEARHLATDATALGELTNAWDLFVQAAAAAGVEKIAGHATPPRRRKKRKSTAVRNDSCSECGASLANKRAGAVTCSRRCRVIRHRRLNREAGAGAVEAEVKPAPVEAPEAVKNEEEKMKPETFGEPLGKPTLEPTPTASPEPSSEEKGRDRTPPKPHGKAKAEQIREDIPRTPGKTRLVCRWVPEDPNLEDFHAEEDDWLAEHDEFGDWDYPNGLTYEEGQALKAEQAKKTATAAKTAGKRGKR